MMNEKYLNLVEMWREGENDEWKITEFSGNVERREKWRMKNNWI